MTVRCSDMRFTCSLTEQVIQRLLDCRFPIPLGAGVEVGIVEDLLNEEMCSHRAFDLLAAGPSAVIALAKEVIELLEVINFGLTKVRRWDCGRVNHTRRVATQRLKRGDAA